MSKKINNNQLKNIRIIFLILIIIVLCSSIVFAIGRILVLNLNYDKGDIKAIEKTIKFGYYPDRKIQPERGYTLEMISETNEIVYSFKFEVPVKIYLDSSEPTKSLAGGYIILDNLDFALVMPYFDNIKEIRIYKEDLGIEKIPKNEIEKIIKINLEDVKLSRESKIYLMGSIFGILLILILLIIIIRKIMKKREQNIAKGI